MIAKIFGQNEELAAIDDDPDTYWSSDPYDSAIDSQHEILIDLGAYYELSAFTYLPPHDQSDTAIADYRFFVSLDGADWKEVSNGRFAPDSSEKLVDLTVPSLDHIVVNVLETPLAPGESLNIELNLTTDSTLAEDLYQNMAEITAVYDNVGSFGLDLDSTADSDSMNDNVIDDTNDNFQEDEDDHDLVNIQLSQNANMGPTRYTFCANENEYCAFSGTKDVA